MPGLTVSCNLNIKEIPDVLIIPLETVFSNEMEEFVYVRTGSGFKTRKVKITSRNTDYALIDEGLSVGEELALSDPFLNKMEDEETGMTKGKL